MDPLLIGYLKTWLKPSATITMKPIFLCRLIEELANGNM